MQSYVDKDIISGAVSVILKDNQVVDYKTWGYSDKESKTPYQADTICRIFSNTKIIVSVAAMMLWEQGKFDLDDPLEKYIPEFANLNVLKHGAESVTEVEPLNSKPTIRQLMCHTAGFSYGIFMESKVDELYLSQGVLNTEATLADMITTLATIPLAYQPGYRWQYSVSTDILGRLVEIISGQALNEFLKQHILRPLSMFDTGFTIAADKQDRFATNYVPDDMMAPMKGGLNVQPDTMVGSYTEEKAFFSGGGGLVSTIADYTRFFQLLIGNGSFDGVTLLKSETVALMQTRQVPDGVDVVLPTWPMPGTTFGLGLALKTGPAEGEPDAAIGEFHWGGIGGTHTWASPKAGIAALLFTQRLPGFWHPFSHDYKREVYLALND